jgi:RecJ-like exonuclease
MLWDVCKTCKGVGRTEGNAYYRSEYCIICKGEGKIKVDGQENNTCKICGGAIVDDNVSRLCLCDMDKKDDKVNHPKHYTFGTIEVIDVIEDWQLGFHEGNCIKYIARAKHKGNELVDLKKAQWYLNRKIEQLKKEK